MPEVGRVRHEGGEAESRETIRGFVGIAHVDRDIALRIGSSDVDSCNHFPSVNEELATPDISDI